MRFSNICDCDDIILVAIERNLDSPEAVIETLRHEVKINSHITGYGVALEPNYFKQEGRWFEVYALSNKDSIDVRRVGSAQHDYINSEWYQEGLKASKSGVWSAPYYDDNGAKQLLVYTDGLNEAEDKDHKQLGNKQMLDMMAQNINSHSKEVINSLVAAVENHRKGAEPNDDLTLLCLKLSENA